MTDPAPIPVLPPPPPPPVAPAAAPPGRGCWFYGCLGAAILLLVIVLTAAVTAWQVKRSLHAAPITPTELTAEEQAAFDAKLEIIRQGARSGDDPGEFAPVPGGQELPTVDPDFVRKPLVLTEREINAFIANNTDLGDKVYVTLDNDMVKLKVNYPVEAGAPFLGGKTLRFNLRTRIALDAGRLEVRVTDVAVGSLPIPSAWLKGVKGRNLVEEFAADDQAMATLVAGIEALEIDDGRITFIPAE